MDAELSRVKDDIADLYEQLRDAQQRLTRQEERSDNRDRRIEELKQDICDLRYDIKSLEKIVDERLCTISKQISAVISLPEKKVASTWNTIKGIAIAVIVTALITALLGRIPL